jgi:hypothetical protein
MASVFAEPREVSPRQARLQRLNAEAHVARRNADEASIVSSPQLTFYSRRFVLVLNGTRKSQGRLDEVMCGERSVHGDARSARCE